MSPDPLKAALQLVLALQEQVDRQQAQLERQTRELADTSQRRNERPLQKLAYLFEEGICEVLSLGKAYAYAALASGMVDTYTVGRRRYITHEALLAFRGRLERGQSNPGPGSATSARRRGGDRP